MNTLTRPLIYYHAPNVTNLATRSTFSDLQQQTPCYSAELWFIAREYMTVRRWMSIPDYTVLGRPTIAVCKHAVQWYFVITPSPRKLFYLHRLAYRKKTDYGLLCKTVQSKNRGESIALIGHCDRQVSITECNTTQTATAPRTTQSRNSAQETHITNSNISIDYNVPVCTLLDGYRVSVERISVQCLSLVAGTAEMCIRQFSQVNQTICCRKTKMWMTVASDAAKYHAELFLDCLLYTSDAADE